MAFLERALDAIKFDDNRTFTKDMSQEFATRYLLDLEVLVSDFEITDKDLPLDVSITESIDRLWIRQLRDDIYGNSEFNPWQWWQKKSIARRFGDLGELSERKVLQLNLADDLVMLFAEQRRVELEMRNWRKFGIDVGEWCSAERKKLRERQTSKIPIFPISDNAEYTRPQGRQSSLENITTKKSVFDECHLRADKLYVSVSSMLRTLASTITAAITEKEEDRDSLREFFRLPEDDNSILAECADLRARVSPCRLITQGSYPHTIQSILRKMETRNAKHEPLYLLKRETAKAYQFLNAAIEAVNDQDD